MTTNKVVHLFVDVHMIYSHKGLKMLALKEKVDISLLKLGEFALFVNRRLTAMKLFGANNTIVYYRAPDNRPIDVRAMRHIPKFASGMDIGYERALLTAIREKYSHIFKPEEKRAAQ